MPQLEKRYQRFFYDNLLAYSTFMEHLSKTLYHLRMLININPIKWSW